MHGLLPFQRPLRFHCLSCGHSTMAFASTHIHRAAHATARKPSISAWMPFNSFAAHAARFSMHPDRIFRLFAFYAAECLANGSCVAYGNCLARFSCIQSRFNYVQTPLSRTPVAQRQRAKLTFIVPNVQSVYYARGSAFKYLKLFPLR